jgi:hypothetical protein
MVIKVLLRESHVAWAAFEGLVSSPMTEAPHGATA